MTANRTLAMLAVALTLAGGTAAGAKPDQTKVSRLQQQAKQASAELAAARKRLDEAVAVYEQGVSGLEAVQSRLRLAEGRLRRVQFDLNTARANLGKRAADIYMHGRLYLFDAVMNAPTFYDFARTLSMAGRVVGADADAMRRAQDARAEAEAARADVATQQDAVRVQVEALDAKTAAVVFEMQNVAKLLQQVQSDLRIELGTFRFPLKPPYSYVDSFGAPRMEGTRYAHPHEGTDIFGLAGSPVLAVVAGTVFKVGQDTLGGNKVWLRGPDGRTYYYAHLSGFAPDGHDGAKVEAGTPLGYVGNTGNARGGLPHLHFEVHEPGGKALNPYPLLKESERLW